MCTLIYTIDCKFALNVFMYLFFFFCSFYVDVSISFRCDWVFVGKDDRKSNSIKAIKAEMTEVNRFRLLGRETIDFCDI